VSMAQIGHLLDITLSYVIPAFARILLDGIVLCYCYRPNVVEVPLMERRFGISAASGHPSGMTPVVGELLREEKSADRSPMSIILHLSRVAIS